MISRMSQDKSSAVIRPADERPPWSLVLWRGLVITVVTGFALWLLALVVPGFTIDTPGDALLAGFVIGIANAVVWPALAFLVVPLSVLTLGIGAIVLNTLFVFALLELLPGVTIDGFWTSPRRPDRARRRHHRDRVGARHRRQRLERSAHLAPGTQAAPVPLPSPTSPAWCSSSSTACRTACSGGR